MVRRIEPGGERADRGAAEDRVDALTDEELVAMYRNGDAEAFEVLTGTIARSTTSPLQFRLCSAPMPGTSRGTLERFATILVPSAKVVRCTNRSSPKMIAATRPKLSLHAHSVPGGCAEALESQTIDGYAERAKLAISSHHPGFLRCPRDLIGDANGDCRVNIVDIILIR